jgi:hypothetical protein
MQRASGAGNSSSEEERDTSPIYLPTAVQAERGNRFWTNKVVLIFKFEHTASQVRQWLYTYNKYGVPKLLYRDEHVNSMFVISIDTELEDFDKALLIAQSPVKAREIFALVNDYYSGFDQVNPSNVTHLVSLNISNTSPTVHLHLQEVVSKVGRLVRSEQAAGVELHGISALVETSKRIFPKTAKIELGGVLQMIKFDIYTPNLRCQYCFSYRHFYKRCPTVIDYGQGQDTRGRSTPQGVEEDPRYTQSRSNPRVSSPQHSLERRGGFLQAGTQIRHSQPQAAQSRRGYHSGGTQGPLAAVSASIPHTIGLESQHEVSPQTARAAAMRIAQNLMLKNRRLNYRASI